MDDERARDTCRGRRYQRVGRRVRRRELTRPPVRTRRRCRPVFSSTLSPFNSLCVIHTHRTAPRKTQRVGDERMNAPPPSTTTSSTCRRVVTFDDPAVAMDDGALDPASRASPRGAAAASTASPTTGDAW